jgi:hypothetical protein
LSIPYSLALFEALSNRPLAARTLLLQGEVAASRGDFPEALNLQKAALKELSEIEDAQGIATALEAIACTLAELGRRPDMFLTLTGAAAALRRKIRIPLGPARRRIVDGHAETVAESLDAKSARAAEEDGRIMSVTQVVEFVLGSAS